MSLVEDVYQEYCRACHFYLDKSKLRILMNPAKIEELYLDGDLRYPSVVPFRSTLMDLPLISTDTVESFEIVAKI